MINRIHMIYRINKQGICLIISDHVIGCFPLPTWSLCIAKELLVQLKNKILTNGHVSMILVDEI
jgi:hypothetical protein